MKYYFLKKKWNKRRSFLICLLLLCIITFACLFIESNVVAHAENNSINSTDISEKLNNSIEEFIGKLDLDELQAYVDSLGNFSNKEVGARLLEYIKGDVFQFDSFFQQMGIVLFAKVTEILPSFICIMAITLLSGLIATMRSDATANTSAEMFFLISYAATLIPLLSVLIECIQESRHSVSEMQKQMQLIFPLMLTLMAASGGSLTAAVCRPAVGFFATNIVSVIHSVVFPITMAIMAFSMVGNLTNQLKISKFTAFFKSINKWVIGICVSAFGIFFTLQGITAANYDGIVRRAAKYAIGNGVPIVGGFLSGGFDLAVAGSVLIKNSLGCMGLFLMLAVIFEPLILLIAVNILLRLTAAITQPFGGGRISDFLGETAENLHYCTAGLLFTAFLYFLAIMLMVCASEALF